jgi:oxygen-dependent protoporphyrinogen oxidase
MIWVSSLFPAHAPEGFVNLRVLLGGARDPEVVGLPDDVLLTTVLRELATVLGLRGEPAARRLYRYPQGIPQYNVGHDKRLRRIEGWLERLPGLYLTGNAYRGVGINDCVEEGGRVAAAVLGQGGC